MSNTSTTHDELSTLVQLQEVERREDLAQYRKKMHATSIDDRIKEGVCWYPLTLNRHFIGTGERINIEVERTRATEQPHVFQPGKSVSVFSNSGSSNDSHSHASGVVKRVQGNRMVVSLNTDELPDWLDEGKLGLHLLFDEATYDEMKRAVQAVREAKGDRLAHLREVLLGNVPATFAEAQPQTVPHLNNVQQQALNQALTAHELMIVHGPPGTGKTTTLIEVINNLLQTEKQVLVCAPSNAAVDLLAERLNASGTYVVRTGHPARVTDTLNDLTLDARIAHHESWKDLRVVRRKAEELRRMATKYKRKYGREEAQQRRLLLAEVRKMKGEADVLEHYIVNDVIGKPGAICCTLAGAAASILRELAFKTVVIDEAAQAMEGACWIPILKAQRVILAGDHFQLPPTIKSFNAAKQGLATTLFEKAIQRNQADVMLQVQYRMNAQIMAFSGNYFYKGQLKAHPSIQSWLLAPDQPAITFIDTAGCGYAERVDKETLSTYNTDEAAFALRHLHWLLEQYPEAAAEASIAVIAPYSAQVKQLKELAAANPFFEQYQAQMRINTIDGFQGQEKDIIYISLVRSNEQSEIGFLQDIRRMNVAITRARKKLVIVGDSATVGSHTFYSQFIDYAQQLNAYHSAFEFTDLMV